MARRGAGAAGAGESFLARRIRGCVRSEYVGRMTYATDNSLDDGVPCCFLVSLFSFKLFLYGAFSTKRISEQQFLVE